jgi:hypothetical protein
MSKPKTSFEMLDEVDQVLVAAEQLVSTIGLWNVRSYGSAAFLAGYAHAISDLKRWQELQNLQTALKEFRMELASPPAAAQPRQKGATP